MIVWLGLVDFFQPQAILTSPHTESEIAALGLPTKTLAWDFNELDIASIPPIELSTRGDSDLAYLQFTSGTTGQPKAAMIPHSMLLISATSQIVPLDHQISRSSADICVAAVSFSHVTGLVGAALGGLLVGMKTIVLAPSDWVQKPALLLQAIAQYRGTYTMLTNTGLNLSLLRIQPEEIEGIDLSSLRLMIIGAEMISSATLRAFSERFGPYGFRSSAFKTAYSSLEAFSFTQKENVDWRAESVSATELMTHTRATPIAPDSDDARSIVSCGTLLTGVSAQIRDEAGNVLPDRTLGEIVVHTPMLFSGYWKRPDLTEAALQDGWYLTGDLGYMVNDELFVVGRLKDLIIVGGRNLLPDAVEEQAMTAGRGLLRGAVAFGVRDEVVGTEQPVVVCELIAPLDDQARNQAAQAIRQRVRQQLGVALADVHFAEAGWIVRAGIKLARTANREKYLAERKPTIVLDPLTQTLKDAGSPQEQVMAIFEEILGRKPIGPDENFFDIGGDSISALKMLVLVEKHLGRAVPPEFFQRPTIAHLVALLGHAPAQEASASSLPVTPQPLTKHTHGSRHGPQKRAWSAQRVRAALRWRMADYGFRQPYFDGVRWLANWCGNPWVQRTLFPQEVQLMRHFWESLETATALNPVEIQQSIMSYLLVQRRAKFLYGKGDTRPYAQRLQECPLPLFRDMGTALTSPESDLAQGMFEVHGQENLEEAGLEGQGVVLVSYHATMRSLNLDTLHKEPRPMYWLGRDTYTKLFYTAHRGGSEEEYRQQISILRAQATQTARDVLLNRGIVGIAVDTLDTKNGIQVAIGNRIRQLSIGFAELALTTNARIMPTYTVLQADGKQHQYLLPAFDMGSDKLDHAARIAHLVQQSGNFLAHAWRHAPSTFNWPHMQMHLQMPKAPMTHHQPHSPIVTRN